jgi:hypothetical protein
MDIITGEKQRIICDMHINKSTKKSNESKINAKIQNP